mmetsp:Transcript_1552/g.6170  ORF Transcript_1552/g.6170 Transcript_1552/m.6170 type:complete len:303 (-) Transcript_1552:926-1834(-)
MLPAQPAALEWGKDPQNGRASTCSGGSWLQEEAPGALRSGSRQRLPTAGPRVGCLRLVACGTGWPTRTKHSRPMTTTKMSHACCGTRSSQERARLLGLADPGRTKRRQRSARHTERHRCWPTSWTPIHRFARWRAGPGRHVVAEIGGRGAQPRTWERQRSRPVGAPGSAVPSSFPGHACLPPEGHGPWRSRPRLVQQHTAALRRRFRARKQAARPKAAGAPPAAALAGRLPRTQKEASFRRTDQARSHRAAPPPAGAAPPWRKGPREAWRPIPPVPPGSARGSGSSPGRASPEIRSRTPASQ